MLGSTRRSVVLSGALVAVSGFLMFAAADDPTTDIVIHAPDMVFAPSPIQGYVIEYTPAVFIFANSGTGQSLSLTQSNPNSSTKVSFFIPTDVDRAPEVITITATDSAGQNGTAFVAVLRDF